jgi:hypothetical protein
MFHVFQILTPWTDESRTIDTHVRSFVDLVLRDAPIFPPEVVNDLVPVGNRSAAPLEDDHE